MSTFALFTTAMEQTQRQVSSVLASLNYADETKEFAHNFPQEGAIRHEVDVMEARGMNFTLKADGFQLLKDPKMGAAWRNNLKDVELLKESWYPAAEALAKDLTGAQQVRVLNHVYRSSATANSHEVTIHEADRDKKKQGAGVVLNGVDGVHADFTPGSMYIKQLEEELQRRYDSEHENTGSNFCSKKRIRVQVVNIWQSISEHGPIQRKPLCLAHPSSVRAGELRENYKEMNGNTVYNLARTPESQHEWWYYSQMALGEMLVFYGYDESMPVLHTAFDLRNAPANAPPRESLETRVMCVFEEEVEYGQQHELPWPRL